jgi:hypothetical protein
MLEEQKLTSTRRQIHFFFKIIVKVKISILKRVDSILVPRGVCRLLIGCTVIVKIVRYDYDMTVLWI